MIPLKEKIEGGIFGLLIGDALGVPYEFHPHLEIPPVSEIEFEPPKNFRRAHRGIPPGTWSDDGAQALALLASLLDCGKLDVDDFGRRIVDWYERGYKAVDEKVFDVGIQTGKAIRNLKSGVKATKSGPAQQEANGNGSLMRVLPLALWHKGSDEELVKDAQLQSVVTHGHSRSQVCCALYCLWAKYLLAEETDAWEKAVLRINEIYAKDSQEYAELKWSIRPDQLMEGRGTGYVVDCLRSAKWVMNKDTFEEVVKAAVSLGNDTDTTACVAGGVAGIRNGIGSIPKRWIDNLRGKELFYPELQKLIEWRC